MDSVLQAPDFVFSVLFEAEKRARIRKFQFLLTLLDAAPRTKTSSLIKGPFLYVHDTEISS